eukprot:TRINITY_DN33880_c1_g1_i1.p1 TRINITY_DN33880_c1_g1~~TRINITY_DN33880_c1_g1_i1.p1  ORF type:complete len:100 (+),score=20.04 TRINITY_DN33880_c1_g1_i1:361-660(+)
MVTFIKAEKKSGQKDYTDLEEGKNKQKMVNHPTSAYKPTSQTKMVRNTEGNLISKKHLHSLQSIHLQMWVLHERQTKNTMEGSSEYMFQQQVSIETLPM